MSGATLPLEAAAEMEEECDETQAALTLKASLISPELDDELKAGADALDTARLALAELHAKVAAL